MSLKKYLLILFLFTVVTSSYSQVNINTNPYWEGEIEMTDGSVKYGYVQIPNITSIKKVVFRKTRKGKKESIKRKLVASVKVVSPNGKKYHFERIALVPTLKGNSSLGKSLILVEARNSYATFYISSATYKVNKKSNDIILVYKYLHGKDFPVIGRYIRKQDAEKANMFYITGYAGGFKRAARHHLKEDPELLERIENKELGKKDIPEIIDTYLRTTDGM